ncbi:zinc finger protein GAI-ASSOCIATED FACTOR 1-like [Typha angustifolia]|uniref:zinc finger protein GAI-ASSOCIATED FACTOR 1-like n=1 Tax=Typha angustifolia TaxID=59011 RepID=UPI003C302C37
MMLRKIDPTAKVIALSPRSLLATDRYVCEQCNKSFIREQNLKLHMRSHQPVSNGDVDPLGERRAYKRAYICPEPSCVYNDPARALGDITGIKKHYGRKHGEKKWQCDRCLKKYAVELDWKAHIKVCNSHIHKCDCGMVFAR